MIKGFIFNDVRSWDMGIEAELVSMPLSAEPKNVYIDIPTADGELDLSKANSANRIRYKPRMIEFLCHATFDPDKDDFESRAAYLASVLCTDDDRELRIAGASPFTYRGRASSLYNITPESDTSFSFPLVFKCQPFRWATDPTYIEGEGGQVILQNDGLATDLLLSINGYISDGVIVRSSAYPERELRIPPIASGMLYINTETMRIILNDEDITALCEGEFFDVAHGENIITAETTDPYATISAIYTKKYI